ncbi:NAD(P)-binding protein [Xylaria sp. FL0043]|nr:NAD(P)-binding protein [Xylaria sp. FL0043]
MSFSVIITGANGSLALPTVSHLLNAKPNLVLILTVRNATEADVNTQRLRHIISRFPKAKVSIHEVDLANLASVHQFASHVVDGIRNGVYPALSAIICTAYYWDLVGDHKSTITGDGYDKTFQVNLIAHAALVLRLLGSFHPDGGRILTFTSDAHWPGKNLFEKIPPAIPGNLNELVNPQPLDDRAGDDFHRYANSKLAIVMWTYALNRHLQKAAMAMNPGNLVDSRALRTNTPSKMANLQRFLFQPFKSVLRLADATMRTAANAAADVVELATSPALDRGGFYNLLSKTESAPDSYNEEVQDTLWTRTLNWAGINEQNIGLGALFH